MNTEPPAAIGLNVGALSAIFDSTATSYKHLFFIGLIQLIENRMRLFDNSPIFGLNEITVNSLSFGWYPHRFFKLSFGVCDQIANVLDSLVFDLSEKAVTSPSSHQKLQTAIANQFDRIGALKLHRYAPQRLLTPFFRAPLRGIPDHKKDEKIHELAEATFSSNNPPLYRFLNGGKHIEIHPLWMNYLQSNYSIIKGWALNHWSVYLQTKNPNTPAIIKKIAPLKQRESLVSRRRVWKKILYDLPLECIYSGQRINPDRFDLDHFLPWSFTCHNQYWNLIPSDPGKNRSLGRTLPTSGYVQAFINAQTQALKIAQRQLSAQQWANVSDDYITGLGLAASDLLCSDKVKTAYTNTLNPMISLARSLGY